MEKSMFFTTRFVSSLEKVFCQPELSAERIDGVSGAGGETIAFQLAMEDGPVFTHQDSHGAEFLTP